MQAGRKQAQRRRGRCGVWRLAAKEPMPVRYPAPVAATKERALLCRCAGHQAGSKQEARGAAVHERFAISGARALAAGWQAEMKRRSAVAERAGWRAHAGCRLRRNAAARLRKRSEAPYRFFLFIQNSFLYIFLFNKIDKKG